jgi:hypothetical protein
MHLLTVAGRKMRLVSSGQAVTQESLGRSPISVNLRFRSGFSTPKGQEDSARGFNPGESVSNEDGSN